jgi:conjugal transfer pilus assembly protein TraE
VTIKLFLQKSSNIQAENRLLKFVVMAICAVTVFNSFMINKAMNYQRVVLIPPGLDSKVEVTGGELSEEYIKTMVRYASSLAFTYSPATARKQFDALLSLFSIEAYPQAQQTFYELAGTIETANVSSVFYLDSKFIVDARTRTIEIIGQNRKYKDSTLVSDTVSKYVLEYVVNNGKFQLTKITAKERERGK